MKVLLHLFFLFIAQIAIAQSFTAVGGNITDNGLAVEFPVIVSGLSQNLGSNFGLASVCFSINHANVSDVRMAIQSPTGKRILLFNGIGGTGNNFVNTCLGGLNQPLIFNNWAPYSGTYRPFQSLGHFNNGQSGNGIWKLIIWDDRSQNQGSLTNWSITFNNQPAELFPFSSTNLPLLLVDTRSQIIPDEPKLPARIRVINNVGGARNYLNDSSQYTWLHIGIELRGSSSADFPKKSYGFEFRNAAGEDTSLPLLGMPAESDWILSASYSDKTLMRNAFAYHLSRKLGWYAPRTRHVELMLNGEYQGVYVLTEKIKRDANRVSISKLKTTDVSGPDVTGGYIIKIDKTTGNGGDGFVSNFPPETNNNGQTIFYQYEYPDATDIVPQQKNYIKAYVDSFETAAHSTGYAGPDGYRKFVNLPSFIDYFIVNEWSKNVDGYRLSTFLTKPKITQNGGKLVMGPVWDYDIAWRNADYCEAQLIPGWIYRIEDPCPGGFWQPPTWWTIFRTDPNFNNDLKCRWNQVIQTIMPPLARAIWIDSVKTLLNEAQIRNFSYWPILGRYVWPNPQPVPINYLGEITNFQNWLNQRANWIGANLGGTCLVNANQINENPNFNAFPNPTNGFLTIEGIDFSKGDLPKISNIMGQTFNIQIKDIQTLDVRNLKAGLYWIRFSGGKVISFYRK